MFQRNTFIRVETWGDTVELSGRPNVILLDVMNSRYAEYVYFY